MYKCWGIEMTKKVRFSIPKNKAVQVEGFDEKQTEGT